MQMRKETLGLIILVVAVINVYWSARVYTLMSFEGNPEEVAERHKKAKRLSLFSKLSYLAVVLSTAIFIFFKGV
jgi:hypothetical protein